MSAVCSIEKDGTYHSGDLMIAPNPAERVLVQLYYRFEADDRLDIIFHESGKPTLRFFLETYMAPETSTLVGYRTSSKSLGECSFRVDETYYTPIGMAWINRSWPIGVNFKKAECGMAFVRHTRQDDAAAIGRMTIEWAFDNLAIDSLFGCTPAPNRAAVLYGQMLGFQQTTPLEGYSCWHGKLCSVILQSMTKERWRALTAAREAA